MLILIDSLDDAFTNAVSAGVRAIGSTLVRWSPTARRWPDTKQFLLLTDCDVATLARYAAEMRSRQIEPRRTIIRAVDTQPADWVYHDLPVFASVTTPRIAADAAEMIRRLVRARSQGGTEHLELASAAGPAPTPGAAAPPPHGIDAECERLIDVAARTDLKVLLIGETGTGKNTFARRIHDLSARPGPFVSLNCAALPETLIESELFGAEAGAFTGAQRGRPGKFEIANEGTLFLDEIDSLALHLQTKLLGAIQDSGTTRLGDHRFRHSAFRLITASQRPLDQMVAAGTFRADLYHRVAVIEIRLPAVRHMGARLIVAFEEMLARECKRLGVPSVAIEPSLYSALLAHDWPGNFRELETAAQRHAVGLPPLATLQSDDSRPTSLRAQMHTIERLLVGRTLALRSGNLRAASEDLGLPLETLRYRLRLLGLHARQEEAAPEGPCGPETLRRQRAG